MWIYCRNLTLCLVAAALACGCGSSAQPDAAAKAAAAAAAARKAASSVDAASRNLVGAVALNKTPSIPVEVRFALHERPAVAQPVDIDLVIVPLSASVDRVLGKVVSEDGLEVVDGAQIPATDHPTEGVPIRHTIRVVPRQDGIFMFSAVVTVDSGGEASTQSFVMPVIAGAGLADLPASAPAAGARGAAAAPGRAPPLAQQSASGPAAAVQ